jgi:hypothetical protein
LPKVVELVAKLRVKFIFPCLQSPCFLLHNFNAIEFLLCFSHLVVLFSYLYWYILYLLFQTSFLFITDRSIASNLHLNIYKNVVSVFILLKSIPCCEMFSHILPHFYFTTKTVMDANVLLKIEKLKRKKEIESIC